MTHRGELLKKFLYEADMTPIRISEIVDIARTTIHNHLKGETAPNYLQRGLYAKAMRMGFPEPFEEQWAAARRRDDVGDPVHPFVPGSPPRPSEEPLIPFDPNATPEERAAREAAQAMTNLRQFDLASEAATKAGKWLLVQIYGNARTEFLVRTAKRIGDSKKKGG